MGGWVEELKRQFFSCSTGRTYSVWQGELEAFFKGFLMAAWDLGLIPPIGNA